LFRRASVYEGSANSTSCWESQLEAEIDLRTVVARFGRDGGNPHQFFSERDNREDKKCTRGGSHAEKFIAGDAAGKLFARSRFFFRDAQRNAKPRTFRTQSSKRMPRRIPFCIPRVNKISDAGFLGSRIKQREKVRPCSGRFAGVEACSELVDSYFFGLQPSKPMSLGREISSASGPLFAIFQATLSGRMPVDSQPCSARSNLNRDQSFCPYLLYYFT